MFKGKECAKRQMVLPTRTVIFCLHCRFLINIACVFNLSNVILVKSHYSNTLKYKAIHVDFHFGF